MTFLPYEYCEYHVYWERRDYKDHRQQHAGMIGEKSVPGMLLDIYHGERDA